MSLPLSDQTSPLLPQPILRLPFPYKLYKLLDDADKGIHSDIVSWLPQGNGFKIHDSKAFCLTIMKTYFNQSKLKSFTRQLYLYGFLKVSDGPNEGAFFHPKFVRGDREACLSIRRNQFEGDRRQSKQRTKNVLPSRVQEDKTSVHSSSQNGSGGGGVPLVDSTTSGTCCGTLSAITNTTTLSSCSEQSLTSGGAAPPPFDNSGEPFKAALTIFDRVFNLIDDDGSCDAPRRKSAQGITFSPSQSRRRLSIFMRKNQEPINSPLPMNQLQPMVGGYCSWDASYTMNHSISADCLLSNSYLPTSATVHKTVVGSAEADDDWLEKLEGSLGEPLLLRVEEDVTHPLMDAFDFSPRPIEEMFHCQPSSHVPLATNSSTRSATSPPRPFSSMIPVTMDRHHEDSHHQREGGGGDRLGVSTIVQRSRGLPV